MSKHDDWQAARKRTQVNGDLMHLRSFEIEENLRAVDADFGMPKIPTTPRPEPKTYRIENKAFGDAEFEFDGRYKGYHVEVRWQGRRPEDELDMDDFVEDDGEFDAEGWMDYDLAYDDGPEDGMAWYIRVWSPSLGTAYDGHWGDKDSCIEAAVEEALRGSCLIAREQAKFPELWKEAA